MWRETEIWHVVIPDRIVEDQLMISLSPIISNASVAINHEGVNAEHLEACRYRETTLSCACYERSVEQKDMVGEISFPYQ